MDSNAFIDSYNSGQGDYASQSTNGSGNDRWANENGTVGSNEQIRMKSNSAVHGDGVLGPSGSIAIVGNSFLTGAVSKMPDRVELPAIALPSFPSKGALSVSQDQTLSAGQYYFTDLEVGGNKQLTIAGPTTLVVDNLTVKSNAKLLIDPSGGKVNIYVTNDFILNSNTLMAPTDFDPAMLEVQLLSDNILDPDQDVDLDDLSSLDFDSNAEFYGTIYAPDAQVEIDSNFEFYGSLVARRVHLDSNSKIHFDEALLDSNKAGKTADFETICWRLVAVD